MNALPMPVKFDKNEWFLIISFIFLVFILIKLPKRFPTSITTLILTFSMVLARVVDHLLAGPKVDFYDVLDTGKFEFFDIFAYIPYAPCAYLFIYVYHKYQIKRFLLVIYIFAASLGSIAFERFSVYVDFFKYKSWKLIYSLPVYLAVFPCLLLFYHFLMSTYEKDNEI